MAEPTDRIEKRIHLRASRERVWGAISDHREFGSWFGVRFEEPFAPGKTLRGRIVPTTVDPEVARAQQAHQGVTFQCTIDRVEPMSLFSFRWHPFAVDPAVDYSQEPTTLVVFRLEEAPGGTLLTITESGFDKIPLERRVKAFQANEGGWEAQAKLIEKYLARVA